MRSIRSMYAMFAKRPWLRVIVQTAISVVVLALLIRTVQSHNILAELQSINPVALIGAAVLYLCGYALNTRRWQILLEHHQIRESYLQLLALYFIGLFCSLFLPSGTGGDAVRAYEVARSSGRPVQAVVATLQERLLGLGSSMLIGFLAICAFLPVLPEQLAFWALVIQGMGVIFVGLLMYPAPVIRLLRGVWGVGARFGWAQRLMRLPIVGRATVALKPVIEMPTLSLAQFSMLLLLTICASLMGISVYYVLGMPLGLSVGFLVYCLTVPLVWIIRMIPISLGGIGVGEGTFVFLIGLFAIPNATALALALAVLGVQTATTLIGGVLMVLRALRGARLRAQQSEL